MIQFLVSIILNTAFLFLVFQSLLAAALHPTNETDRLALLAFKDRIHEDPLGVMNSWNESFHFCNWRGVSCSNQHEGRVTELNLGGQKLVGSLPPHTGNLSFLRQVDISQNFFKGEIPQEIGHLLRLKSLDLSENSFEGKIPSNLSFCSKLEFIELSINGFTGEIPIELGRVFNSLRILDVFGNQLTGSIPQWLGNASSLDGLDLGQNNLHGNIPNELGKLANLQFLQLGVNYLSGKVPFSIYNLSLLSSLAIAANELHGRLPSDIGFTLPNLEKLFVDMNYFSGEFPPSLLNATNLETLDMGMNNLGGAVPSNLGSLENLEWLALDDNYFGEELGFISSLTNCSSLQRLHFGGNHFKSELPTSIANLSTKLHTLSISENQISGKIPRDIGNLVSLTGLFMYSMELSGEIPSSIGKLSRLSELRLETNGISGSVPSSLGNVTQLQRLYLSQNNLSGRIPLSLSNCSKLEYLYLDNNHFTGNIPRQVFKLFRVLELSVAGNSLSGQLPSEVWNMVNLVNLSVSDNMLSGRIPSTLGNCLMLEQLEMKGNLFGGEIPSTFTTLKSLQYLDLSRNNLSGRIPDYLQNLTLLRYLNLSFNDFEGELPVGGVFGNASNVSVSGIQRLCGGIHQLGLPPCKTHGMKRRGMVIAISGSCSALLIVTASLVIFLCSRRCRKRKASIEVQALEIFPTVSYAELRNATNGFSPCNLIGEGSFGSVYRGALGQDGMPVAIKVLNLFQKGAFKSFIAECETLRNIRHRNLIKIITVCSSIDFKGADFKAIVYKLMQNGSLDEWLHPKDEEQRLCGPRSLSFVQRLNIAIDVAGAIEYLHSHCQPPIIHGDLKPSNILLDEDMVAHVSDFGLARFLSSSRNQSSSVGVKGTIGYVAPEYGVSCKASKPGDVYGFGIILLEMITGKRPTDTIFKDSFTIHQFTKTNLSERVIDMLEPSLLQEVRNSEYPEVRNKGRRAGVLESIVAVARVGILCSMESPDERMEMEQVTAELCLVKDKFLGKKF